MKKLYTYYYFNNPYVDNKNCIFTRFSVIYNSLLSDRFNYLNQFSKWNFEKFNDQLPQIKPELSYKEICLNRAKELMDKYPEGIAIGYSGGVDSTGILALLILQGYPVDKINLVCNKYSLEENNFVYDFCLKNKVKVTIAEPTQFCQHFHNIPEKVIVFGGCNDQFFHVGSVYRNLDKQLIPIQDSLSWFYKNRNFSSFLEKDLEIIQNYSKLLNWPIKDLFDLSVVTNFGCRYTFIQNHLPLQTIDPETQNKVINFYDNQDFQDWALTNREINKEHYIKSLTSNLYYKYELKQIIDSVFHNKEYLHNKGKEGSWRKAITARIKYGDIPLILSVKDSEGFNVKWWKYPNNTKNSNLKQITSDFFKDYLKPEFQ